MMSLMNAPPRRLSAAPAGEARRGGAAVLRRRSRGCRAGGSHVAQCLFRWRACASSRRTVPTRWRLRPRCACWRCGRGSAPRPTCRPPQSHHEMQTAPPRCAAAGCRCRERSLTLAAAAVRGMSRGAQAAAAAATGSRSPAPPRRPPRASAPHRAVAAALAARDPTHAVATAGRGAASAGRQAALSCREAAAKAARGEADRYPILAGGAAPHARQGWAAAAEGRRRHRAARAPAGAAQRAAASRQPIRRPPYRANVAENLHERPTFLTNFGCGVSVG